jgi:hypothetical protein
MPSREEKQNQGYDEAVRGNPPIKLDITDTNANDHENSRGEKRFDRAADEAATDVRRHEHSAD